MNDFQIGDEVIRKSGRRVVGTVVAVGLTQWSKGKDRQLVRVRWHNALRPFSGGYSDNHTNVLTSSLVPATEENKQKMRDQIQARRAAYEAIVATYRYCSKCHTRLMTNGLCCYCDRQP